MPFIYLTICWVLFTPSIVAVVISFLFSICPDVINSYHHCHDQISKQTTFFMTVLHGNLFQAEFQTWHLATTGVFIRLA